VPLRLKKFEPAPTSSEAIPTLEVYKPMASVAVNVLGWLDQQLPDGTADHSVPCLSRRRTALSGVLCRYGAEGKSAFGRGSVRLAMDRPPLRIALVVGDVFALIAFERGLSSWNVLLCIASGARNGLHPFRDSR
jgi:hypothetical protein